MLLLPVLFAPAAAAAGAPSELRTELRRGPDGVKLGTDASLPASSLLWQPGPAAGGEQHCAYAGPPLAPATWAPPARFSTGLWGAWRAAPMWLPPPAGGGGGPASAEGSGDGAAP
eukprot:gene1428-1721_t